MGKVSLDAYKLKWIAIIGMLLNHIFYAFYEIMPLWLFFPLMIAGGLTFPIMGYLVAEGYKYTDNLKKYILRILIFGMIAIPFHILVFQVFMPNIMFTIALSIIVLLLNDKIKKRLIFWLLFALILLVSAVLSFDWGIIGIVVVLLYHRIRNENKRRIVPPLVAAAFIAFSSVMALISLKGMGPNAMMELYGGAAYIGDSNYWIANATFSIGCIAAGLLLLRYNGQRGKRMKWLFYVFYPLHLAILGIIALLLGYVNMSIFRI